jgi:hypothetical protein
MWHFLAAAGDFLPKWIGTMIVLPNWQRVNGRSE